MVTARFWQSQRDRYYWLTFQGMLCGSLHHGPTSIGLVDMGLHSHGTWLCQRQHDKQVFPELTTADQAKDCQNDMRSVEPCDIIVQFEERSYCAATIGNIAFTCISPPYEVCIGPSKHHETRFSLSTWPEASSFKPQRLASEEAQQADHSFSKPMADPHTIPAGR